MTGIITTVQPQKYIETVDGRLCSSTITMGIGQLRLMLLPRVLVPTAISNICAVTASTASAGTTLARMGVYQSTDSGNTGTLIASTANDTTLFSATYTSYSRSLSSPVVLLPNVDYYFAAITVSTTAPAMMAVPALNGGLAIKMGNRPPINLFGTGQSDLPATFSGLPIGQTAMYGQVY